MIQEIIPMIDWEQRTFSTAILGVILFASLAIFPILLIPCTPSMWVAGMTFGYGYGFLMIISGVLIGSSIPYFIGSLFYHRIHVWQFNLSVLIVVWFLYSTISMCHIFSHAGMVRKAPKESFYHKTSWRGKLV